MTGFAIIIGKCFISPTSPIQALAMIAWLFGMGPPGANYHERFVANGYGTEEEATFLEEKCFADWPSDKEWKGMMQMIEAANLKEANKEKDDDNGK